MPRMSGYEIRLSSAELEQLERRAGKYTLPYFQVQRAKMILLAAEGFSPGLEERSRPGRPRIFSPRSRRSRSHPCPAG